MSEWKLAMPAAENWQELTDALDKAQPHPEGKVTIKGDGVGLRWRFNKDVLEKVATVLGVTFTIEVADVRSMMGPGGGMDGGKLKYQWLESLGGAFGYQIHVNPLLSPETANLAIWHEIQHMFQLEEGRMKPFDLTYNVNLPITNENAEKYMADPTEVDADQMALNLHKLQQYSTVIPVSQLEGSEGPYFADLLEEGWPFQEAVDEIDTMVRENEISVDEWMAGRNLQPQSKIAMPYHNNVWYHVTSVDKLDNIAENGLQPRNESREDTNWPHADASPDAVYLWPTISMARAYFGRIPDFQRKEVILRAVNLDRSKMAPDHEGFSSWLTETSHELSEYPDDTKSKYFFELMPQSPTMEEAYEDLIPGEFYHFTDDMALQILSELPASTRQQLVEYMFSFDPSHPIMYYGTIPPEDLSVAALLTYEQLTEQFDEEHAEHPHLKGDEYSEEAEEDYYQKLDNYLVDIMGNQQIREFISMEDIEKLITDSYDDERDEYADNFMYKPVNQWKMLVNPWDTTNQYANEPAPPKLIPFGGR